MEWKQTMLGASHLEMRLMEERKLGKRDRDSRRDRRHDVAMLVSIPFALTGWTIQRTHGRVVSVFQAMIKFITAFI